MADLSHWDFAENFSGYDAAALILGIEPTEAGYEQGRTRVVFERMTRCYLDARFTVASVKRANGAAEEFKKYLHPENLLSEGLMLRVKHPSSGTDEWLNDAKFFSFDKQEFSRDEMVRWLSVIEIKSAYHFDLKQPDAVQNTPGRWPWGNHETELLGHLEAAASEFWLNYDPQNAKATAPKNETVIAWLEARKAPGQSRKVSNQMARAIASMLRPDDLPTGPRK